MDIDREVNVLKKIVSGIHALLGLAVLLTLAGSAQAEPKTGKANTAGKLVVMAKGFKSGSGQFIVNIFDSEEGYPLDSSKAVRSVTGEVTHEIMEIVIEGVAFGEYVVTVVHDADNSGEMTRGFLGIPREAIGISNNPVSYFGAPDYAEAVFAFKETGKQIDISLHTH